MTKNNQGNVGLIGVGVMGRVILQKLVESGYTVYASDLSPKAQEYIQSCGGVQSTAQEVASKSDVILLSLPKPEHVKAVVSSIIGDMRARQVIVDLSTVDPQTSMEMSEKVAQKGVGYLDAPILGRPASVGSWLLPVGGKEDDFIIAQPVLRTFAKATPLVGVSGAGNTLKLLNQLMFSTINGISCEVMAIAKKAGVDLTVFYDTVANSGAATVSGLFKEVAQRISVGKYDDAVFTVDLLCKDSLLGLEMAKSFNSPSIIARSVHTYNEIASATDLGGEDTSAVFKLMNKIYN
jgi:3-hydroxyisobutyrate dehydrogenase-like beta-hydroxyacid dehydrogenase